MLFLSLSHSLSVHVHMFHKYVKGKMKTFSIFPKSVLK